MRHIASTDVELTEAQMTCGIYSITSKATGRVYIGQSQNIEMRWAGHRCGLAKNKHRNSIMQRTYNKYGKEDLVFRVEEEVSVDRLCEREKFHLLYVAKCLWMNVSEDTEVPFRGRRHSDETRARMKAVHLERFKDPEVLEAHRAQQAKLRGNKEISEKLSVSQKAAHEKSSSRRNAVGRAQRARFSSDEARVAESRKKGGRPIEGVNMDDGSIVRYTHCAAVKKDGFCPKNVLCCLKGKTRHAHRYKWTYINETATETVAET